MKKFLLSLIALAGFATINAVTTVTFDFANEVYGLTRYSNDDKNPAYIDNGTKLTVNGGVEVTLTKTADKNGWRLWTDGLRAYKNSDAGMTISAPGHKITKITYTMAKAGVFTDINGTAVSGKEFSYTTPEEETVTLSYNVANNGAIATMVVELDGEGGGTVTPDPVDPDPEKPEVPTTGPGSADQPYTCAEAIAKDNDGSLGWVNGYIVGVMLYDANSEAATKNYFSTTSLTVNSNIVIAPTATETDTTKMVCVQLPAGTVRENLNLADRPGNMGKEVSVCGKLEKYCGMAGVKETSDYTIVGGVAPIPVTETASLTSFVEEQSEDNMKITGTVTVFYQSPDKKYTFITDGETNLEIYGSLPEYHNGDQLTGIVGKYGFYNNMPQMTPMTDSFGEATAGTPVEPTEVAFNQINIAQYVKVIAIDIYEEEVNGKTNYYFGQGDAKRQVFDRFNLGSLKAGICTITGIGAIYGETAQIFPTELEYRQTSIDEITVGNVKGEIFDLQGRKVVNPAKGLFIVNGKKTFVR